MTVGVAGAAWNPKSVGPISTCPVMRYPSSVGRSSEARLTPSPPRLCPTMTTFDRSAGCVPLSTKPTQARRWSRIRVARAAAPPSASRKSRALMASAEMETVT